MDLYSALDDKYLVLKALRHGSHSLTCKQHQPAFSLRSRSPAGAATDCGDNIKLHLTTHYRPRKDERLSWPSWLTYSGRFTHISGHPSAAGIVQDSESSPVKDRRSTAEPRNQPKRQASGVSSTVIPHFYVAGGNNTECCHKTF